MDTMLLSGDVPSLSICRRNVILYSLLLCFGQFAATTNALNIDAGPQHVQFKHNPAIAAGPDFSVLQRSQNSAINEDWNFFNLRCFLCKEAVLKYRARLESKTLEAETAVGGLCKELKLQKDDVCDGIVQEYGPEVISVLAHRLFDPHHLCIDVLHYCPHEPRRSPSEIPCNATRMWAYDRGLLSDPKARLGLLGARSLESVAVPDSVNGDGDINFLSRKMSYDEGNPRTDPGRNPVVDHGEPRFGERGVGRTVATEVRLSRRIQEQHLASSVGPSAKRPGGGVGHFLQLTDVHLDTEYHEGSEVDCGRPLCCRTEDGPAKSNLSSAGPFGDYECDAAPALFESLAQFIGGSNELPALDFAVFTGDVPPHDIWEESRQRTLATMETVYGRLAVALKGVPLYPILGNHAGVPVDAFPDPPVMSWLMDASWRLWRQWLPADVEATVRKGGYYTLLHEPGLRIVGLNTQYCDPLNFWLLEHTSEPDPAGQLEWLLHVLWEAEKGGERVIILGHIPIGDDACYVSYSQRYSLILDRFKNTVAVQIFGHTHSDSFKVYYDAGSLTDPVAVGFVSPSVTPYTGRNPSFRVFDYQRPSNGSTADSLLLDYKQYMLNLDSANSVRNGSHWAVEYGAREAYNLTSMSPKSWHALLQRLEREPTLLGAYLRRRAVGRPWTCDKQCEEALLCNIKSQTFALYQDCIGGQILSFSAVLKILLNSLFLC